MNFKIFFLIISFLFFSCDPSNETDESLADSLELPTSPNILLIIADDFGKDASPNYIEGNIKPNMPNLESLISSGITFDNLWSYPVCTPTRASILTGKYGFRTGVLEVGNQISTNEISIQEYIDINTQNEYATAMIGKWHLSNDPQDPLSMSIDYFAGILQGGVQSYTNWNLVENGQTLNSSEYTTTKFTDLAINWLDDQTKPWFLWLAYNAPHTPFHLAPLHLHSHGNLPSDEGSIDSNPLPYFFSAVEAMDNEMGRLINSLSTEERENTIIIFIGDNGTPNRVTQLPFRAMRSKGSIYQGGINVPMIISGLGVNRIGEREAALIQTTDLYATIARITGVSIEEIHNSKSFYKLLSNSTASKREFVYTERSNNGVSYAIRNSNYKLIVDENGNEEFYNLSIDPYEANDLIGSTLNSSALSAKNELEIEATKIRM
tara:strand:- start:5413 stop:6717 length:1305 start_codon:yes stop_codon:yes gene_type:complete